MGYNKIDKLERLKSLGLNIFEFRICNTEQQLVEAAKEFKYTCTIRSDCDTALIKDGWLFPFYIMENGRLNKPIDTSLLSKGYKFIVANGLKYDKHLRLNLCTRIDRNGDFLCEYSRLKIPLRSMYNHPNELTSIYGNLDENLRNWVVLNSRGIDLREIRDILRDEWLNCKKNDLFGRYIELSTYTTTCGIYNTDKVYWEI